MKRINLVPAYGRDYKSQKEVSQAFDENKDFLIADISSPWDGKPANQTALREDGFKQVNIRYSKQRKVMVIYL